PGKRAGDGRGRQRRVWRRAIRSERSQAGGRGLGRRGQGRDGKDGADAARYRPAVAARRRGGCRGPCAVPPRTCAPAAHGEPPMIGSLRGRLIDRGADEVLLEVAGVGYRVTVTPATVVAIGDLGDEVFVYVHHHVREDAQTLYGFPTRDERACFEALIGAHGVGP